MERQVISVTELNLYVKNKLDSDPLLSGLLVRGEISNFKRYSSGHCYFTLKDIGGAVRAVMFNSSAQRLKFVPTDGMKVIASGRVSLYERDGQYQLYVTSLEPDGLGTLHLAYEQLKARLSEEGLFDDELKREIPKYPRRIGVITSPTGAAVRDIINITKRRFPLAEICVYPAVVQGDEAVPTLIAGLEYFGKTSPADVIIIGRGGGSIEDLWAFNDETLARKVRSSPVPVISAVGHETDFTICDFVADMRAPTPSAGAECATPDKTEIISSLTAKSAHMTSLIKRRLDISREKLEKLASSRMLRSPMNFIDDRRLALDSVSEKLYLKASARINEKASALKSLAAALNALSPLAVLSRGYGAAFGYNGKLIKSVSDVNIGDELTIKISDGEIKAGVISKTKSRKGGKNGGKEKNEL